MITFLATLFASPMFRKIGLYAGLGILILLGLRWYSNKAYSDGRSEGVKVALSESITSSEKSWKADLANLKTQIDNSSVAALRASTAARTAAASFESTVAKASDARAQISQLVAQIPVSDLAPKIVANDATVKPDDTADLERHLLGYQLAIKSLDDEVRGILDSHKTYVEQTNNQIAALNDTLTATQGQLHVMTVERDAYKASFESATKKRGCGTFKKIVTLGVCR